MAAVFYSYGGSDVFHGPFSFKSPINVAFMDGLFDKSSNLALITELGIGTTETLQYFLSFDDVINFLHFGKGIGTINISGILFSKCNGDIPGLASFYNIIGGIRGKVVSVSIGNTVFSGTVTMTNVTVISEPDTMAQFQLQLAMLDHTLQLSTGRGGSGGLGAAVLTGSSGARLTGSSGARFT